VSPRSAEQIEARWAAVSALAALLAERGLSEAPIAELAEFEAELEGLIADGVLQRSDERVRFFHDRYLDYVFARSFFERGGSLNVLLKGAEQHLERRAQVRQIINYQREADRATYEQTVVELLGDEGIRFHIKDVVFTILREEAEPSEKLWDSIRGFVCDAERREHPAAWYTACQPAWFRILVEIGTVSEWIESSEQADRERAASMLFAVVDDEPAAVAALLDPKLGAGDDWQPWSRRILQFGRLEQNRGLFDLALRLLFSGGYDEEPEALWHAARGLPESEPAWAAELLGAVFDRAYARGEERGEDPFAAELFPAGRSMEEFIRELAVVEPSQVLDVLLTAILRSARACAVGESDEGVEPDTVWAYRPIDSDYSFAQTVLGIAELTARSLAETDPADWRRRSADLLEAVELDTPRFLLYRAWEANPAAFADQATQTLIAAPARLRSGYAGSRYWVTRGLLQACSPLCSEELFAALEDNLIGFLPAFERRDEATDYRGQTEFVLLSALDPARLSKRGCERLAELEERFPYAVEELAPSRVRGGFVGSPIPEPEAAEMSDQQWLAAIELFVGEERTYTDEGVTGGAEQVARQLEAAAKREPDRFARLGIGLGDEVNVAYFEALLRGLIDPESDPDPGLAFELLRRCHALPGRPCGRWIGDPLRKLAEEEIPTDVLEIVAWYAREDPNPERDSWRPAEGETEYWGGEILTAGINSVRGAAAVTISALIFDHAERVEFYREALGSLVADPVLAVRACAAEALTTLSRHDQELATALFSGLIEADDELLAAQTVERFLSYRALPDWESLGAVVERMLGSELEKVQQAGARRVAICAFEIGAAAEFAEAALAGSPAQRKGIAQVAAANVAREELRERCEGWLLALFADPEEEVRHEAANWVHQLEADELGELEGLATAFMDSPAYIDDPTMILMRLEETDAVVPELMLRAALRFAEGTGRSAADIRTSAAADAPQASNLAMRAYSSTDDPDLRSRALDAIDLLLASGVRDMQERISTYDE